MTQELRRKQIEEILLKKRTGSKSNPVHEQVLSELLSLLSDAERKGAWAVVRRVENAVSPDTREQEEVAEICIEAARQVASSFGPDPEGEGK